VRILKISSKHLIKRKLLNYTGQDIKAICKEFDLTQEELGMQLGISKRTIQSYIGGRAIPDPLQKLITRVVSELRASHERETLVSKLQTMSLSLDHYIDEDTIRTLDDMPKEAIIAYLLMKEKDFKENGLYEALLESKLADAKLKWETQRLLKK
jgi:DNA-binding transcriptional regulator YiaG